MAVDAECLATLEQRVAALEEVVARLESGKFDFLTLTTGLQIIDEDSSPRVAIRIVDGEPAIGLWGRAGSSGIYLSLGGGSPAISVTDANEKVRLKLSLAGDGEPMIIVADKMQTPRLTLSVLNDCPRLMLHDSDHTMRLAISLEPQPSIEIYDDEERTRISLSLQESEPLICTLTEDEHVLASL